MSDPSKKYIPINSLNPEPVEGVRQQWIELVLTARLLAVDHDVWRGWRGRCELGQVNVVGDNGTTVAVGLFPWDAERAAGELFQLDWMHDRWHGGWRDTFSDLTEWTWAVRVHGLDAVEVVRGWLDMSFEFVPGQNFNGAQKLVFLAQKIFIIGINNTFYVHYFLHTLLWTFIFLGIYYFNWRSLFYRH